MTALECLHAARAAGDEYQRAINVFIDGFRRANDSERAALVADPILECGEMEGLVAAVVSALCREQQVPAPRWLETIRSPAPFFAFPARTYAMRVRLMFEAPAPFRVRNVFVPSSYLSRA
jgi:hypothetical protein